MTRLDDLVGTTVDDGVAPFLCAGLTDRAGIRWLGSAGQANDTATAGPDTGFRLFSLTKGIGSLMALIAIDRGMISMDTPIGDVLPTFDELKVLEAITDDGPQYREPKRRATLRHVLTHTQGQGYEAFYPLMMEYATRTGAPGDLTGLLESLKYPLLFDPGDGFAYGIGTDWVGMVVSKLDGRPVEQFVREEILGPLRLTSTAFEAEELGDRLADVSLKNADGSFEPVEMGPPSKPEFYHMGHSLYSTATDYLRFLRFVLNRGELDGVRLFGPEAANLIFESQMRGGEVPTPVLSTLVPSISYDVEILPGTRKTHTASFFMNEDSLPGLRGPGSLSWAGVLNTHCWVDPANDVAGVYFSQMLPFWEPAFMRAFESFERTVYEELDA